MNTINGIPFLWDIEEDNRLFRQIDPFLRNTNTTNFGGLSTNKRFDEITFEKKIGEEFKCLPCQDSFYKGVLNFNLLISDLRERQRFDNDFFYYQKYTQNLPKVVFENAISDSFSASPYLEVETSVPFEYTDPKTKKRKKVNFKVGLNTRACLVNYKQFGFKTIIDEKNETLRLYVEYIYTDSLDKRVDLPSTENPNDYHIEDKYIAIKIETDNFGDFFALSKEIDLYNQVLYKIKNLFVSKINTTTNATELDFLYENLPDEVIEIIKRNQEISEDKIWNDILAITSLDSEKRFTDTSSALLNALKLIGYSDLIYYKFVSNQALVKTIYNNLDGSSIVNGQMMSNKMQFASFIFALCTSNGNKRLKKLNKTFKYGANYFLDSDVTFTFNEKEDEISLQQLKKETHYYQVQTEMDDFGISTPNSQTEVVDVKEIEVDEGNYYKVLDIVYLKDTSQKNGLLLPVPALFIKALSDEAEFQEIEKNIRLGFDIVAVVAGLITLATTANPGVLALALADVALATGDIAIQGIEEELKKTPEGQEFLATWEKIYMVGGIATALISAPQLVQSFYNGATKFIKFAVATKNYNYLNFARALVLSAYLEINIANFIKNTVRLLNTDTKIVLATAGVLNKLKADKLFENGVLTVIGEVQTSNKTEEQIALIYKGEAIIKAPKKDFFKASYELLKKLPQEKKFIEACEEIKNIAVLKREDSFLHILAKVLYEKVHPLSKFISLEEEAVIRYYTTSAYEELNKFLRKQLEIKNEKTLQRLIAFRDSLKSSLEKLPKSNYKTFYRSFYMEESKLKQLFKEGNIYTEDAFMSAAFDYDDFLNNWLQHNPFHNVIMKIEGKTAKEIRTISELPEEAEAMFNYGKNFDVIKIYHDVDPISYTKKMIFIILKEK